MELGIAKLSGAMKLPQVTFIIFQFAIHLEFCSSQINPEDDKVFHICNTNLLPKDLISLNDLDNVLIRLNFIVHGCSQPRESLTGLSCVNATLEMDSQVFEIPNNLWPCESVLPLHDCLLQVSYSRAGAISSAKNVGIEIWTDGIETKELGWNCQWIDNNYLPLLSEAVINTTTTNSTGIIDYSRVKCDKAKQKDALGGKHRFNILICVLIILAIVTVVVILVEIWNGKNRRDYFARKSNKVRRITVRPK